jgi:hypothetical protein
MISLSVSENIENSKNVINKLKLQLIEVQNEILRMEGSLRVFDQMKQNGIDIIQIKSDEFNIENTEVNDSIEA